MVPKDRTKAQSNKNMTPGADEEALRVILEGEPK